MRRTTWVTAWILIASTATALVYGDEVKATETDVDARLSLEFNQTDGDAEVVISVKGSTTLRRLRIDGPGGKKIAHLTVSGKVRQLGLTDILFESPKPQLGEVLDVFPEGTYEFAVKTVEGEVVRRSAHLSHKMLPAPVFTPKEGDVVEPDALFVRWAEVKGATGYIITIGKDGEDDVAGAPQTGGADGEDDAVGRVTDAELKVTLPAGKTSLQVPAGLLQRGKSYEIDVAVVAPNGNITIADATFQTQR